MAKKAIYEVKEGDIHIFKGTKEEIMKFFEITKNQFEYALANSTECDGKKFSRYVEPEIVTKPKRNGPIRTSSGVRFN